MCALELDGVKRAEANKAVTRRRVDVGIFLESVRDRESMAFCGLTEKWPSENRSLDQDFFETGKAE